MIATVQRVKKSNVSVEKKIIADIKIGLNVFLGIMKNDDKSDAEYLAKKYQRFVFLMIKILI